MITLGKLIKNYRTENNLSLRDFAEKCGVSHSYIDKLEKGVDPRTGKPVEPTLDTIEKIACAVNMSLEELLNHTGKITTYNKSISLKDEIKEILFRRKMINNKSDISEKDLDLIEHLVKSLKKDKS